MNAVADRHAGDHGREGDPLAQAAGDRARELAEDHCLVGGLEAGAGRDADLVLADTVLGPNQLDPDAGLIERRDKGLGERGGLAKRAQAEAAAAERPRPAIVELVLEARPQAEPFGIEGGKRALQEAAQTALPGPAVGVRNVAEDECSPGSSGPKSTSTRVDGSGISRTSPSHPKGVSAI
jgi:hypothetical protein